MNPTKTQAKVYKRILKFGNTLSLADGSTIKGIFIEDPGLLPHKTRNDFSDLPQRVGVYFLIGVPPEPTPVDEAGSQSDLVRLKFPEGRAFTSNGIQYKVMREVPLAVGDINIYLLYQCSAV